MFKKIRENMYARKIAELVKKVKEDPSHAWLVAWEGNSLKSQAAHDYFEGKISEQCYRELFLPEGAGRDKHFLKVLAER